MGTIVGIRVRDGVVLGADRRTTDEGTIRSDDVRKLFSYDAAGVAIEGALGNVEAVARKLEEEIRQLETRQGRPIRITPLERLASRLADRSGVVAIVAARNADDGARLREVDADGGTYEEEVVAFGSGARLALGRLEGEDRDVPIDEGETLVEQTFAGISERDTGTSESCDVLTIADGGSVDG